MSVSTTKTLMRKVVKRVYLPVWRAALDPRVLTVASSG